MSLLSQLSQNFLTSLFGKKKNTEGTREINSDLDNSSSNSIPSFSVLNHSYDEDQEVLQSSTITKRENIFMGKDIDSNDTNEIIDYNLRKLRQNQDVNTTCIDASDELVNSNKIINTTETENNLNIKTELNTSTSLNNIPFEDKINTKSILNNNIENDSDNDTDSDSTIENVNDSKNNEDISDDSESDSDSDTDSDTDSDSDSDSDLDDTDDNDSEILYVNNSSIKQKDKQQQHQQSGKSLSKHNSIDDIILEDLDLDKLIYNVPPPMIKVSKVNPLDNTIPLLRFNDSMSLNPMENTIPLVKFKDSMSVPASMTKFKQTALGRSYATRNILSSSLSANRDSTLKIPGIRTIELRKPIQQNDNSSKHSSQQFGFGKKHSAVPISTSFSPKELSAPLSTSLLALQNEQPSFASLICNDSNNEIISDTDPSYYPLEDVVEEVEEDDEEEYDIFNYSMNKEL